jgi:methylmalonyl-CoA mutase C-terminal domain/subunit
MELLKENNIGDIVVIGGGVIPEEDIPELKKIGIAEIFTPGTNTRDIIKFIKEKVK